MSVGSDLRQIRESKNITLESVSQKTKIPVKFLEAIEEDNFKVFPSHTYARGFIRAYAKVVGSDVYVITRQFNSQIQPETVKLEPPHVEEQAPVPLELKGERPKGHFSHESRLPEGSLKLEMVEEPVAEPADLGVAVDSPQVSATEPTVLDFRLPSARKRSISWKFLPPLLISAAVVLGVALVGYYGWKAVSKIHWSLPKHEAAVEVAREESAPPPVADKYQHLILKALDNSWVRVIADGKTRSEADMVKGDVKTYQASKYFTVKIGNAGGVDARFNGKPLGILGVTGQIVEMRLPSSSE